MMRVLENEDFRMAEKQTYFSSWSRAEILFARDFDEFNETVRANMDSLVRQPLEEVCLGLVWYNAVPRYWGVMERFPSRQDGHWLTTALRVGCMHA